MANDVDRRIQALVAVLQRGDSPEALAELKALGARDALRHEARESPNLAVREDAISALSSMRHPGDLDTLLDLFRDDYVQDLAQLCVERDWGATATVALVARLGRCDSDCLCLLEALENVGDESALGEPLLAMVGHEDHPTADAAAEAIVGIGTRTGNVRLARELLERGQRLSHNIYVCERVRSLIDYLDGLSTESGPPPK